MIQVSLKRVPIRRDMAETLFVDVGEHEIPVLSAVHGQAVQSELIEVTSEVRTIDDPRIEYERMQKLYGRDSETGRFFVDEAYTSFRQFMADLNTLNDVPPAPKKGRSAE